MQEQPEKVSENQPEVISNSATPSEEAAQREPFRAKFRSGTPRRKSDPIVSTGETSEKRSSSRLPPLEVEVTGLRPVKRHAPAFFRDRAETTETKAREASVQRASQVLDNDILIPGRLTAEQVQSDSTVREVDTVPHFTDEEFDDWLEAPQIQKLTQQPRNVAPTQDRTRVGQGARPRGSRRASNKQRPAFEEARFNSDGSARKENSRAVRPKNEFLAQGRASSVQQFSGHSEQRRGSRGTPQDRRPNGHRRDDRSFGGRGTDQPQRSSRNSAELIDTTAQRLYGGEPSPRPGWTPRSADRTIGDRRIVSERRRPIHRRFDDR